MLDSMTCPRINLSINFLCRAVGTQRALGKRVVKFPREGSYSDLLVEVGVNLRMMILTNNWR